MEKAIADLVREICLIQAAGDRPGAAALLEKGVLVPDVLQALGRLKQVPVDIRPVYVGAGEAMPQHR